VLHIGWVFNAVAAFPRVHFLQLGIVHFAHIVAAQGHLGSEHLVLLAERVHDRQPLTGALVGLHTRTETNNLCNKIQYSAVHAEKRKSKEND
jgi:hypothetical protein